MRSNRDITLTVTLVVAMASTSPSAWAISVGNGPGQGESTSHTIYSVGVGAAWFIPAPPAASIPVTLDPSAGPWSKRLDLVNSGNPVVLEEGQSLPVIEFLKVDGNTPWTDWHEEILTPGWEWHSSNIGVTVTTELGTYPAGPPVPGLSFNLQPTTLDFFFDPILPGTEIFIVKSIRFVGVDANNPEETTGDPVFISEYPTPEPATLGLLLLGGLALLRRRR